MSTLLTTNLKNSSSGSNNIVLNADGSATAPSLVPPGTIQFYAANTAPLGWVKANGAALSRSTYANLFAAIGTTFGAGDGSTTFDLPDMRGEFPRGWDDGRSIDTGRGFGSSQADALQGHYHEVKNSGGLEGTRAAGGAVGGSSNTPAAAPSNTDFFVARDLITNGTDGTPRTASETRPRNIALLAIIKY